MKIISWPKMFYFVVIAEQELRRELEEGEINEDAEEETPETGSIS